MSQVKTLRRRTAEQGELIKWQPNSSIPPCSLQAVTELQRAHHSNSRIFIGRHDSLLYGRENRFMSPPVKFFFKEFRHLFIVCLLCERRREPLLMVVLVSVDLKVWDSDPSPLVPPPCQPSTTGCMGVACKP